jgi:hypothetical protein
MSPRVMRLVVVLVLLVSAALLWQGTLAQDPPTQTPIPTLPPAPTDTPTPIPTDTPVPTATATAVPPTPVPPTSTSLPPTATSTPVPPTATASPTPTAKAVQALATCWAPFEDGFESGSMANWTSSDGISVQQAQVFSGANAALAQSAGLPSYARKTLACEQSSIYYRVRFQLNSKDGTTLYLIKMRTTANASIGGIFITENGRLAYRNDNAAAPHTDPTTIIVSTGVWHEVELHASVNGGSGQIEVWYDGQPVSALTKADNLGAAAVGRVQLGDNNSGRNFSVVFDDVCVDTSLCPMITTPPPAATNTPIPPTATSTPTPTNTAIPTLPPTSTNTAIPPTATSTSTQTQVASSTPTSTPTASSTPTVTSTATATLPAPTSSSTSTPSGPPPPCWSPIFEDFESGSLAQWPGSGLTIQQTDVDTGSWAVSAVSTAGTASYGRRAFSCDQMSAYMRVRFKIISKDATSFYPLKFRTGIANASIGGVFVNGQGRLSYRSDAGNLTATSTTTVSTGVWHTLEAHFDVANQVVEVWYDGAAVPGLVLTGQNLGSVAIGRAQLGENSPAHNFDVRFDNVCVDLARCPAVGTPIPPTITPIPTQTFTPIPNTPTPPPTITPTTITPTSTPSCWSPFFDGFETGNMSRWTFVSGLTAQQTDVDAGNWAASGTSTAGTAAYARRVLTCDQNSVYYRLRFKLISKDATSFYPLKFRTGADVSIGGVFVDSQGLLSYRSDAGNITKNSTTIVTSGVWHTLEAHFAVTNQVVEVWYDGAAVAGLTLTGQNLGTVAIGRAQLGENSTAHNFNVRFDTICVDVARCPASNPTPTPTPTLPPGDAVIVAAGDIACSDTSGGAACKEMQTSDAALEQNPSAVLLLGDNQYECGKFEDYMDRYDPSWGRMKGATHPSIGNHEYSSHPSSSDTCYQAPAGAPGTWQYFGAAANPLNPNCTLWCQGYYSFDVGSWHVIAINSNCSFVPGGCGANSAQEQWLRQDLAAHTNSCTLAYWHHPLYSSGQWGNNTSMKPIFQALYDYGAEIVLVGHDHNYEQFAPQDAIGNLDTAFGIREFVVGTGGRNFGPAGTPKSNSEIFNRTSFGVLKLSTHGNSYEWQFIPAAGYSPIPGASGSATCHGPKIASANPLGGATTGSPNQETPGSTIGIATRLLLTLAIILVAIALTIANVSRRVSLVPARRASSPDVSTARGSPNYRNRYD